MCAYFCPQIELPCILAVERRLNDFPFTFRDLVAKLWRKYCETFFPSVDHLRPACVIHVEGVCNCARCTQHAAVAKRKRWSFGNTRKTIENRNSERLDIPRIILNASMTRHLTNHAYITNVEVGRDAVHFIWRSANCGGNLLLKPRAHSGIRNNNGVGCKNVATSGRRVEIRDNWLNDLSQVCNVRDPQTSTEIFCHVAYPSADNSPVSATRSLYCRGVLPEIRGRYSGSAGGNHC